MTFFKKKIKTQATFLTVLSNEDFWCIWWYKCNGSPNFFQQVKVLLFKTIVKLYSKLKKSAILIVYVGK